MFRDGVAAQNLASDTTYLVCAFSNSGVVTADFRTTLTHAPSSTAGNVGVEIPTGLDTRTVIGMIRTGSGPVFINDATRRQCISWFNRKNMAAVGLDTALATTTSASPVELNTSSRASFVTWGNEDVAIGLEGSFRNNSAPSSVSANVGIDGAGTVVFNSNNNYDVSAAAAGLFVPAGGAGAITLAEGYHFATPLGWVSTGTGLFTLAATAMVRG